MEEDLKDIDLIDRYLNNELDEQQERIFKDRYLNDPEFKKEVEAYQKIYEGVEKATRDSLKQRLEGYYNEYIDEDLTIEEDTKVIPMGRWRSTAWISGIAASVLLVAFGIWYFKPNDIGSNQQVVTTKPAHKIDSPKVKPGGYAGTKENPSKDQTIKPGEKKGLPLPKGKGDQYGLTGGQKVNLVQVLQANYPQSLSYTFKDGLLSIYGDPLLGMIRLHVFKRADQYYLWYDGDVYKASQTSTLKKLEKAEKTADFGTKSSETIKVQIEPLQASATPSTDITVHLNPAKDNRYFFIKEKDKWVLELQGSFVPKDCVVINLKKDNKQGWYLIYKSSVYLLDQKNNNPAILKELSGLMSEEARLFIKREPVNVPVYVRK